MKDVVQKEFNGSYADYLIHLGKESKKKKQEETEIAKKS